VIFENKKSREKWQLLDSEGKNSITLAEVSQASFAPPTKKSMEGKTLEWKRIMAWATISRPLLQWFFSNKHNL
jgi:hypothetical protein